MSDLTRVQLQASILAIELEIALVCQDIDEALRQRQFSHTARNWIVGIQQRLNNLILDKLEKKK